MNFWVPQSTAERVQASQKESYALEKISSCVKVVVLK